MEVKIQQPPLWKRYFSLRLLVELGVTYRFLGPLTDLAENLFTVFYFSEQFTAYSVFIAFISFDLLDVCIVKLAERVGNLLATTLSVAGEIIQGLIYMYFCAFSATSIIFFTVVGGYQILGKVTGYILPNKDVMDTTEAIKAQIDEVEDFKNDESIKSNIQSFVICCGYFSALSTVVVIDALGFVFTLGGENGPFHNKQFSAILSVYIWAALFYQDMSNTTFVTTEFKTLQRLLLFVIQLYVFFFYLYCFSISIRFIQSEDDISAADRGLCTYSICIGSILLCSFCCLGFNVAIEKYCKPFIGQDTVNPLVDEPPVVEKVLVGNDESQDAPVPRDEV